MVQWIKSPDVIVLRGRSSDGLNLVHRVTKETQYLDQHYSDLWLTWNEKELGENGWGANEESLVSKGFITKDNSRKPLQQTETDHQTLQTAHQWVRWYLESPDLVIIFNTELMRSNNPLMVLGPYGSLCWRGVVNQWPVRRIREEAVRIFGVDDVISFLNRLIKLNFLSPVTGIKGAFPSSETIVKDFHTPEIQFRLSHAEIPWYCSWEICTICDLRCRTCYLQGFTSHGPDQKMAGHIAEQIVETGVLYVSIMGGEPLLREDLEKHIETLRNNGVFVNLISNGQSLTKNRALSLASAGLNKIEISFDGLSRKTHEIIRGKDTYDKAVRSIVHAREVKIPRVGVVWTIHKENFHELDELPAFLNNLNIQECYLSLFKKTGCLGDSAFFEPVNEEMKTELYNKIDAWKKMYPHLIIVLNPECSCGRTSLVIGYDGSVRTCPFEYKSIGNIFEDSLIDIWKTFGRNIKEDGPLGYCGGER